MKQLHQIFHSSFDTFLKTKTLRTSGGSTIKTNKEKEHLQTCLSPLALNVFASKTYQMINRKINYKISKDKKENKYYQQFPHPLALSVFVSKTYQMINRKINYKISKDKKENKYYQQFPHPLALNVFVSKTYQMINKKINYKISKDKKENKYYQQFPHPLALNVFVSKTYQMINRKINYKISKDKKENKYYQQFPHPLALSVFASKTYQMINRKINYKISKDKKENKYYQQFPHPLALSVFASKTYQMINRKINYKISKDKKENKYYQQFPHPLALSVFASKTYRRVISFCLLTISLYTLPYSAIIFEPIESYNNQNQQKPSIDYQSFEALSKHANNFFVAKQYDEAIAFYKQAIALNPTSAQLFFNIGQALYYAQHYPEALEAYKKTVRYKNNHHRAYVQMAQVLLDVKQPNDAIKPLQQALILEPNNPEARLMLARIYNEKRHFGKAIETITEGLALEPTHINLTFELANTYNLINRLDEALTLYQNLDQRLPNNQSILYNIAFTYKKLGHLDKALPFYNKTLELNPNHAEALFSRGLAYLVIGDFEKGWHGYEWRYNRPSQGSLRNYDQPRWDGSNLHGKTILIHAEQGLGDTFQFIRYAKLVKEKNGTVIVAVQQPLVTIIKRCKYIDHVISLNDTPPHFDVHAPIMSLPYILKTTLETIPNEHPYLYADETLTTHWKNQLTEDKNFKIGICWQGNDKYATPLLRATVAQKSVHPQEFAPLSKIPGISLYSLQKTTGTDQLNTIEDTIKIITFDGDFDQSNGRFMDTASVMKNLDLIITVDTSICHLAAGLGVATWVLLPNPADWRWMMDRTDTPWYPTMRLFKQHTPGDWETMIQEVAQELTRYINNK